MGCLSLPSKGAKGREVTSSADNGGGVYTNQATLIGSKGGLISGSPLYVQVSGLEGFRGLD